MIPGLWTPDRGLPDGARAQDWLREQRRRERYRWRQVREEARRIETAAPTLISYTESASWVTTGASKATASVSWQTNDVIAVLAAAEGFSDVLTTPTATGLTFTKQQDITNGTNTRCAAFVAAAVAGSTSSSTVTVTNSGGGFWGFGVWVWRGSAGIGTSSQQATTTKTKAQTNTGANGGMIWGAFDFNADAAFTNGTPTPTNTRQNAQSASHYTRGVFDLADQTSAGSVNYGFTGGGTTGPFSIVILEIKNDGGGAVGQPTMMRWQGTPGMKLGSRRGW